MEKRELREAEGSTTGFLNVSITDTGTQGFSTVGPVPCPVECKQQPPLLPTEPEAPLPPYRSCDNQNCLWPLPSVP